MLRLRLYLLLGALSALAGLPLKAAHIIGGELSYTWLGGNQYRLLLDLYRDCAGGGALFDDPVSLFVYEAASGNLHSTLAVSLPPPSNISPDLSDPCLVSPPVLCVEKAEYTALVNLPPLAGGYYVVYQRCCRNNTILNLFDPGATGSTYVAFIPGPGLNSNSSPRFNSLPPLVICRDEELVFDHSATDPDGDELLYALCRPFEGATPGCPMPSPLATGGCPTEPGPPPYGFVDYRPPYSALFPLDGTLDIDPETGLLTGTPIAEGQYVVGICVEEYRAGVLIATHYRDFQFNVVPCDRSVVAATTPSVLNCDDFTISFDNTSSGAFSYFWDFGVGGASSTQRFPTFTFPDTGTYTVLLVAEPGAQCSDTVLATVAIYPGADADFSATPACPRSPTGFADLSSFTYGTTASWRWEFGDGVRSHLPAPSRSYREGGVYPVSLVVTSSLGCVDSVQRNISIPHAPEIALDIGLACLGVPLELSDSSRVTGSAITGWIWSFGDGSSASGNPVTHTYNEPGTYALQLTVGAANGCDADTLVQLVIRPPVQAEIMPGDTICQGDELPLQAGGGLFYTWDPPLGLDLASIADPLASPLSTTDYIVTVSDGCSSDTASTTIWVLPAPPAFARPDTSVLRGEIVALQASGGISYAWFPPEGLSDPTSPFPLASPDQTTLYTVWVTGENGCGASATALVEILPRCKGYAAPNVFTPDGDGLNDLFRPRRLGDERLIALEVYNRWGQRVFATAEDGAGWDGTFRGIPQPLGAYLYILRAACADEPYQKAGSLTLIR